MAKITLDKLRHSYLPDPQSEADYALKNIDLSWSDGGAYALLGPSGCGKSTLLNIISGLLKPSEGRVLFDETDVTSRTPDQRNIAQVFQFPVIYDTMTVYNNLAFPLRNRGVAESHVDKRVKEIAEMLELTDSLKQKAAGLSPDNKQKISMGRGLVRDDVNVIMFDEPLTVIDPHLKWKLRSKLKELHHKVKATMIYVTHDQTEALTFADQVVVMDAGHIVQVGTPIELFERPAHTFVGHFIGSPGMNVLPCEVVDGDVSFQSQKIQTAGKLKDRQPSGKTELGIRPEFIRILADDAQRGAAEQPNCISARIHKVSDLGRQKVVETRIGDLRIHAIAERDFEPQSDQVTLSLMPSQTRVYADGWLASEEAELVEPAAQATEIGETA